MTLTPDELAAMVASNPLLAGAQVPAGLTPPFDLAPGVTVTDVYDVEPSPLLRKQWAVYKTPESPWEVRRTADRALCPEPHSFDTLLPAGQRCRELVAAEKLKPIPTTSTTGARL